MQKALIFASLVTACISGLAQLETPRISPSESTSPAPTITFTQSWAEATPPYYSIVVSNDGQAAYHSSSKAENLGEPYDVRFVMSDANLPKVVRLAKELNFFDGNFDYKKNKIAFTGAKTLQYKDGKAVHATSYNWSDNINVQQLTALFQGISETIELGRLIGEKYRFDKLGVDAEMKKMEAAAKAGRLEELQAIEPILTKIAKDPSMMNITRRRAEFLLSKIPKVGVVQGRL
jgi:hypothetical protein